MVTALSACDTTFGHVGVSLSDYRSSQNIVNSHLYLTFFLLYGYSLRIDIKLATSYSLHVCNNHAFVIPQEALYNETLRMHQHPEGHFVTSYVQRRYSINIASPKLSILNLRWIASWYASMIWSLLAKALTNIMRVDLGTWKLVISPSTTW